MSHVFVWTNIELTDRTLATVIVQAADIKSAVGLLRSTSSIPAASNIYGRYSCASYVSAHELVHRVFILKHPPAPAAPPPPVNPITKPADLAGHRIAGVTEYGFKAMLLRLDDGQHIEINGDVHTVTPVQKTVTENVRLSIL
jgi:hypothetical protein